LNDVTFKKFDQKEVCQNLGSDRENLSKIDTKRLGRGAFRMIGVYRNFKYNIEKARCLLDLVIIKKFRDEVFDGVVENLVDNFRRELKENLPILRQKEIVIKGPWELLPDLKAPPASPIDFVPRFCSLLNLSSEIRAKAIEIIKRATEKELTTGRGPIGIAAAAIYIAAILSGESCSEEEIAKVAGTTEITIRNRYKELSKVLDIDELR